MADLFDQVWEEQKPKGGDLFDQIWEGAEIPIVPTTIPSAERIFGKTFRAPESEAELTGVPGFMTEIPQGIRRERPFIPEPSYFEKTLKGQEELTKGIGEAALGLATGFGAFIPGAVAEIGGLIAKPFRPKPPSLTEEMMIAPPSERPPERIRRVGPEGIEYEEEIPARPFVEPPSPRMAREIVSRTLTYEPRTEMGRGLTELGAKPFDLLFGVASKGREYATEKFGETVGSIVGLGLEALTLYALGGVGRRFKTDKGRYDALQRELDQLAILRAREERFKEDLLATQRAREAKETFEGRPERPIEKLTREEETLRAEHEEAEVTRRGVEARQKLEQEYEFLDWGKFDDLFKEGKAVNIGELETLLKNHAERVETWRQENWLSLPQRIKDQIAKDSAELKARVDNIGNLTEGVEAPESLIITPVTFKPKELKPGIPKPPIAEPGKVGVKEPTEIKMGDRVEYNGEEWEVGFVNQRDWKGTFRLQKSGEAGARGVNRVDPSEVKLITPKTVEPTNRGQGLGFGPTTELQKLYETLVGQRKRTEPLPKYARSINLERQKIKEEFKNFEADLAELLPEKKVQTWDQSGRLANEILSDYRSIGNILHKAEKGYALNTEEILAARTLNVTAINRLAEIGETKNREIFNKYIQNYSDHIFKVVSDASSEAGRALNIHKKFVAPAEIAATLKKYRQGLNDRQFKEFLEIGPLLKKDVEGLTELEWNKVQRFIDRLPDPTFKDYFYEYWYNSILSGIPTHIVNFAGNTLWQAWDVLIHRPIYAAVDSLIAKFKGREREIFFREIFPMMAGLRTGMKKGIAGAWEVMKTGESLEFQSKWDREIGGGTISAFERSPNPYLRAVAPYITAPSRALRAMDVWANSIAFDAKMKAIIEQRAIRKGLKPEEIEKFKQNYRPTEEDLVDASEYAKHITFMDDPGKTTKAIIQLREKIPLGTGRLFVAFINTIANLWKRGIELTPGIGLLAKGKMTTAEMIAKQIEGSILSLTVFKKALDGELIGPVPSSESERERFYAQGKLPWSIKIGDTYHQFRRYEPFATPIAMVAIAFDKIKRAKSDEDATATFANVVGGFYEYLMDSSYMAGAIQMLQRHGNRAEIGLRQLTSLVPFSGFWRSMNRAIEAYAEGNATVRESKTALGAFSQVIPTLYKLVPGKLNLWGDEITLPGGVFRQWLPFKYSEQVDDRVEQELEQLERYPAHPSKQMMIGNTKLELPEDFYRDYCIHFGKVAKNRLDRVISSPGWATKIKEQKLQIINRELDEIRRIESLRAKREYVKQMGFPEKIQ